MSIFEEYEAFKVLANSTDPDQTMCLCSDSSGSILFATHLAILDMLLGSKMILLKF